MKSFKQYLLSEGKYPLWVRVTVGSLVLKVRSLSDKIAKEEDTSEQNKLISQQNKLLSYISGLGIGVGTEDKVLLQRLKSFKTKV
jgi:hypothetical protein